MWIYFLIFFVVAVVHSVYNRRGGITCKQLAIFLSLLCIFVAIADMIGGFDRYIYAELFDEVADATTYKQNYADCSIFELYRSEQGYGGLNVLISYITSNRYVFIVILTIIIYLLFYVNIKEYCTNYSFVLMLFMGMMFFYSFTYLRQMIGAGVAWLAIKYIYDRKLWNFLLVIMIAASFHNSAIIFIPIYFIPIRKFKKQYILTFMALCLLVGMTNITGNVFSVYGDVAGMEERAAQYSVEGQFRIEYVVEALFFLYFMFKGYYKIKDGSRENLLFNIALLFCATLLFFVRSENGGRLGWFFMIGVFSTLSFLFDKTRQGRTLGVVMPVVMFLLFARIVLYWGPLLSPYKTFFTPGHRINDPIFEQYEYDPMYDVNKFYRPIFR